MKQSQRLHLLIMSALFAAAIAVMTAYLLHIPIPTGGYIHVGDALIYLAACLLPAPYAVGAAMVGAGLADLLTAPMWVVPTLVIKAVVALLFTSRSPRLLCPRNLAAAAGTCLLSPAAYGLAACLLMGSVHAFWPQFLGTLVQGIGSGVLFVVLGLALERSGLKARFSAA
ncbi:TIGR04002 family protein [Flavonifractor sp. An10]|uniref:TIGR04002 family protein n=1 Tax=Flavonifractor sp. An10 TaxID=1965537 RepID=UPI000B39A3EE|nr:TIGR04002 family protein [Flavonifractor sp. An10]OUQ83253.1 TIGR04002 family protein [Flavonifractor sp. An10]